MAEGGKENIPVYFVEGKRYNISDAVETFPELEAIINEVMLEVGDKDTETQRIVERIKIFMTTSLGDIKKESKLQKRAKQLRGQLRKRITITQSRILELLEADPKDEDAVAQARKINTETVELQRLSLDETALTLIIRKDMTDDELTRDRELRAERHERINRTLERAALWLEEVPTQEDGRELELSMLASDSVPQTDNEYDDSILRIILEQDDEELVQQAVEQEVQATSREKDVSPEPEKRPPDVTSTPKRSPFETTEEVGGTKSKKRVSYELPENLETIWTSGVQKGAAPKDTAAQGNGVYSHPGYNPNQGEEHKGDLKRVPNLKPHEQQFYQIHNHYQTEMPLFPGGDTPSNLGEETIMPSVHREGDSDFTKTIKNLSNNLAMQYTTPGPNEKVPKFDGDYTKWNTFWQAFTVLVDRNPRLPTVTKLNRLNAAVEGEAHQIISMFEFDEDSYELAKIALIGEYGDPVLGANKMLKDLQNMERVKAGDIEGLRNIYVRSKQLVLRLQRLYPSILEQPILISSIIENKMSPECLRKWEEENTRRRREKTLPPPNNYVVWTLNWLNDYIQTNKRSSIKMTFGDKKDDEDKKSNKTSYATVTKKNHSSNGLGQMKTLNNFFTMADAKKQWSKTNDDNCVICEGRHFTFKCPMEGITGKIARERVMKAGVCLNCFRSDHYAKQCKYKGCHIKGCGKKHNWRLHDPVLHGPRFGIKKNPQKTQSKNNTRVQSKSQQ